MASPAPSLPSEKPFLDLEDDFSVQDSNFSPPDVPSFNFPHPPPWDSIDWTRKSDGSSPPFPYTPSYASFNSHGSNQSVYSVGGQAIDDDVDEYMSKYAHDDDVNSPFIHQFSTLHDQDDEYNPTHFDGRDSSGQYMTLLEDQLGHISPQFPSEDLGFVERLMSQSPSYRDGPQFQVTPAEAMTQSDAFGPRSAAHSPGSSAGDLEHTNGRRSRASSVSSFNNHASPSQPDVDEALAGLNFDHSSPSDMLDNWTHGTPDRVTSPPSPAPITISATPPSPPRSPMSPSKPMSPPALIIPDTPHGESNSLGERAGGPSGSQQTDSTSFLFPPQDPGRSLPQGFSLGDNGAGGPSIRIEPSTPVSGLNAPTGSFQQVLQTLTETPSTRSGGVPGGAGAVPPPELWAGQWPHDSNEAIKGAGALNALPPLSQNPYQSDMYPSDSTGINSQFGFLPPTQPYHPPPPQHSLSAPSHLGHRPRSQSHSGISTQWQDQLLMQNFIATNYNSYGTQFPNNSQNALNQGTVNPSQIQPSRTNSPSFTPFGSPNASAFQAALVPESTFSFDSQPMALIEDDNFLRPNSPSLFRAATTGHPSRGHRRGARSDDFGRSGAGIRPITSDDGSLVPLDPRGSGGGHRRRGSSGSATSDRGSPYSRPGSISPRTGAGGLPSIGPVERMNVTTPATQVASQGRRKDPGKLFYCPVEGCGSTFTRQFNLKGHLRSHREERPYVCKWGTCGKGFARQHDCKRHEALHLNIRPFTCEGCSKTFARMDALNRHHKSEGGVECRNFATPDNAVNNNQLASAAGAGNGSRSGGGGGEFRDYFTTVNGGTWSGGGSSASGYLA